ncbi:MAG TPA: SAM-dependent methyltransferase [Myxococcales bacterium]|nr:SAM-dependent methyltransferase [Myxococcales bacterium]
MRIACSLAALSFIACATAQPTPSGGDPRVRAQQIVDAPDRTPEDRALDPGRKPVETLIFLDVRPGMHVAELGAGAGYTTELLARAVAPGGVVYAQNPDVFLQRFLKTSWPARLQRPVMKDVVRVDREFDDPLPPEAKNLDLVLINVIYHDVSYLNVDRDKMNKAVFAALRPGGAYVVIDSSAKEGAGTSDAQTLHRIEEQVVRTEVERAGFKLQAEGDFLRNPQDTRDWNSSPGAAAAANRRGTSDRFALRFVKP